jgi:hypothetical protein
VVDDRALVVRAKEDERAMERAQGVVVEPIELSIGLAVHSDHPPQALLHNTHHRK